MFPGSRLFAIWILSSTLFMACSTNPTEPVPNPIPEPKMPAADSPQHAVDAFRWALEHRSFDDYRTLFTDDYRFAFAAADTNGNAYRGDTWNRDDELLWFQHFVSGGGVAAPVSQISLILDRTLRIQPDVRPGMETDERRKQVTTQCNLSATTTEMRSLAVNGKLTLFLVRGDVARIPADLGRAPDSSLWYIERWEDQTFAPTVQAIAGGAAIAAAQPSQNWTWGSVKVLYLETAPTAPLP